MSSIQNHRPTPPHSWLRGLDLLIKDEKRPCISLEEAQAMVETVGIDQNESIYFLRFLRMMGKLTWFEDGALRDVIITNPIDYLAIPASRVACKLKPTGNDHTTHANEPHHKKAAKTMTEEWITLRDNGVLDVKLLDVLWEEFRDRTPALILLMVKFGLFVPLQVDRGDSLGAAGFRSRAGSRHGRAPRVVPVDQAKKFLVPALLPRLEDSGNDLGLDWLQTAHTFYMVSVDNSDASDTHRTHAAQNTFAASSH